METKFEISPNEQELDEEDLDRNSEDSRESQEDINQDDDEKLEQSKPTHGFDRQDPFERIVSIFSIIN